MTGREPFSCVDGVSPALNEDDHMPVDITNYCVESRVGGGETEEKPRLKKLLDTPKTDCILPANRFEDLYWNASIPKAPKAPKIRYHCKRPASPPYLCMIEGADESKRMKILGT
jgi:hypothetical protein